MTLHTNGINHHEELKDYAFPVQALHQALPENERNKIPLVLVAAGSFSPITYLHLRMFEMARDWAKQDGRFFVAGAYLSPVGDGYVKVGLAQAQHRVTMCKRAVETQSANVAVDDWEALQKKYQTTANVLDHFNYQLNDKLGGIDDGSGSRKPYRILLLGGADLCETFLRPGVWSQTDLNHILLQYGAVVIERQGTDLEDVVQKLSEQKPEWVKNIFVIHQQIKNDVSSTKIRAALSSHHSIKYLVPESVIQYIDEHNLYYGE